MKRTMFIRIFLGYVTVILLLAFGVMLLAPPLMREHHVEEQAAGLRHLALLFEDQVIPYLSGPSTGDLPALVTSTARRTATRITVIDASGAVLADSEGESRDMENHFYRPEIQAALQGQEKMSIRRSSTLNTEMIYMSVPLKDGGKVVGALRLSLFMKDFETLMEALRADLAKVVIGVTVLALILAFFLTRSMAVPLREVIDASSRVAAGDFDVTVSPRRSGEFRDFALSFNAMAGKLKDMFGEIRIKNEEIDGILGSIREGLCVLDRDARVVLCNTGFRRISGCETPEGRHFWEVVRSSVLAEAVRSVRETKAGTSLKVTIGDHTFLSSIVPLAAGDRLVVTIRDVTEFRAPDKT
jgi:two-component system phosphate regulon sensor histidine kinase PhoR